LSRAGDCIDERYQLETEIGAGGLGSVYRATQTKLARAVAVKLLHESMGASDVQRARFEREARALAALEHPNIVAILDYGVADGQPYIVMELLEGETLAQRLRAGRLSLEQVIAIARELLDALAFMHEAGVMHRDLKASNVFLQRVHGGERVKVLDFGLAKNTATAGSSGDSTLTRDGTVVGTPAYMSPEQATGDVVDARSDVYAVGVLLFQMLTGRLPFEGDAIDQVRSHLVEPVPALERAAPTRTLNTALDKLIRRAMAKRREDRFENARAMLHELTNILQVGTRNSRQPTSARAQPLITRKQLARGVNAAVRTIGVLCIALVAAELALFGLLLREPEDSAALQAFGARVLARIGTALTPPTAAETNAALSGSVLNEGVTPLAADDKPARADAPTLANETATTLLPSAGAGTAPVAGANAAGSGQLVAAGATSAAQAAPVTSAAQAAPVTSAAQAAAGSDAAPATGQAGQAAPPPPPKPHVVALGVPGPPRPRNPWSRGVPPELRNIRKAVQSGAVGDDPTALALRAYSQAHPGDARGYLLLAQMYLNRNWRPDAVIQFSNALREDLSARGAPEVLEKLTGLVVLGKAHGEAGSLIVRAYGTEALATLDAQLKSNHSPEALGRLRALRARIAPQPAHP
jgi:serine/threonine-protein kinase